VARTPGASHRRRLLRKCGAPRRGCRPLAPRLPEERTAGGATKTVPTSECRRRHEGTGARTSVVAPPAAPRAVRLAEHSPSRPGPRSRPWFRGAHPRSGHPSIVSVPARSRPWDIPSPRARTPPDATPTRLARAVWAEAATPWLEDASKPAHRCRPISSPQTRVKRPACDSVRLGRACPRCAW